MSLTDRIYQVLRMRLLDARNGLPFTSRKETMLDVFLAKKLRQQSCTE